VLDSQTALYSIGTTEVIAAVLDNPSNSLLEKNVPCYPHVAPGRHLALIGSQTGGRLLEWFRVTFARVANSNVHPAAVSMEKLTERIDDQPGDLTLLPYFAGTGSVRNDPAAKGALVGLTFETTLDDIVKAFLEGITYGQATGFGPCP
jgi:sugar (pentulose or hexulose) kinase